MCANSFSAECQQGTVISASLVVVRDGCQRRCAQNQTKKPHLADEVINMAINGCVSP